MGRTLPTATEKSEQTMTQSRRLKLLRRVALIAVVLGALGSLGLVAHVGQYRFNILLLLFVVWDLSPFAALIVAGIVSKRWPDFCGLLSCTRT